MNICPYCGKQSVCLPLAKNALGVEIQTYTPEAGWTSDSELFETRCKADEALKKLPDLNPETTRVYTRLAKPTEWWKVQQK